MTNTKPLPEQLAVIRHLIDDVDHTLRVPASEYVPAIPLAWSRLDKMAALLDEIIARWGWRPIAEAPKDGSKILCYGAPDRSEPDWFEMRETRWEFYGEGSPAKALFDKGEGPSGAWGWHEPLNNWAYSWMPTHFMPLPPPPAPEPKEEKDHD